MTSIPQPRSGFADASLKAPRLDTDLVRAAVLRELEKLKNDDLPDQLADAKKRGYEPDIKLYQAAAEIMPHVEPILVKEAERVVFGDNFHDNQPVVNLPSIAAELSYRRRSAGDRVYDALEAEAQKVIAEKNLGEEESEYVSKAFRAFGTTYIRHISKAVDDAAVQALIKPRGAVIAS